MNTCLPPLPPAPPAALICPSCGQSTRQNRAGFNRDAAGRPRSQRSECQHCGRTHTPAPKHHGYAPDTRRLAVQQYVDGTDLRRIARLLGVAPQSVVNWVGAAHARLPTPPTTRQARLLPPAGTLELDEVYTFVGEKKESAFVVTVVERETRCILSHAVVYERTWDALQTLVDAAPPARAYFSDGFATYGQLMYPAQHTVAPGKSQTYSVEGDNAELRHYPARLARKSRCFSRCLWAQARAVDLFVYA